VRLLVATRSEHKLAEIRQILGAVEGLDVLGLDEAGVAYDPAEEALEPHPTFEANALSKAAYFHERSAGLPTVADDSGLAVDVLGGEPGVRSKRFAPGNAEGEARDRANNAWLLERLAGVPEAERTARYVCAVALVERGREPVVLRGEAPGRILDRPRGTGGFGYDPLFFDPALGRTFAEVTSAEKHARSHRGVAFRALARTLAAAAREGT
jgi:XTP/dITP diphosphohydrolase